jgi:hypothetical protein
MAEPMSKRTVAISAITIAVILGAAFYIVSLLLSESLYSSRGSFAYWLTISSVIKSVPEVSPTSSPRFYSSAGDGPKLPESAVTYRSSAAAPEITRAVETYLTSRGYTKRPDGDYVNGTSVVSIEVKPDPGGSLVTVRENT